MIDNILIFLVCFLHVYVWLGMASVVFLIILGTLEKRTISLKEYLFMYFCYPYYIYYGYKKLIETFIKKVNN